MFNPQQMMGLGGQLPQLPSVQELWKDEKSKYRHWIILMGIGLIVIFGLLLTTFILNLMDKPNLKELIQYTDGQKYPKKSPVDLENSFNKTWGWSFIALPIIKILLLLGGVVTYLGTVYQSYKEKNFAKLSGWPTLVIGFAAFFAGYDLIQFAWKGGGGLKFDTTGLVLGFVANILFIMFYFGASAPVSKIRRIFMMSTRIETLKKDPQYQAMQQQMQQMMGAQAGTNPFVNPQQAATPTNNQSQTVTPTASASATPVQPSEPVEKVNPEKAKLEGMNLTELKAVAKELSISGNSKMNKEELIESILKVTGNE